MNGFDYFGVRYYLPAMGKISGADPENAGADAENPQSWNGYSYAFNTPKVAVDPDGLATECTTTAATFCAVGTATSPTPSDPFSEIGIDLQLAWASYEAFQTTVWEAEKRAAQRAVSAFNAFSLSPNCAATLTLGGAALGAGAGAYVGGEAGGSVGLAAGSIVPVAGNAAGLAGGAALGSAGGALAGGSFGGALGGVGASIICSKGSGGGGKYSQRKPGKLGQFKGADAKKKENEIAEQVIKRLNLTGKEADEVHDLIAEFSQHLEGREMKLQSYVNYVKEVLGK